MGDEAVEDIEGGTADVEDIDIERLARARRLGRGLRVAARRAIVLARRYREEEGPRGHRETACVTQALAWRAAARDLTKERTGGPGIARAGEPSSSRDGSVNSRRAG